MGSVLVLVFLLFKHFLPLTLACALTIAVLESMTGGIHLRAVFELFNGRRTFPGSGFGPKVEYRWQGIVAVVILLLVKVGSLSQMRSEWQPFAVLLMPILGRGAQTLGIIFSKQRLASEFTPVDPAVIRRQRRALIFTTLLLFAMCLFPLKYAAILIAQYFFVMTVAFRFLNARMDGLTVQTLGTVAEGTEVMFLIFCVGLS